MGTIQERRQPEISTLTIEWAPFRLKPGVDETQLLAASDQLQTGFARHQRGFIKRQLLKGGDNQWVDLVHWDSPEAAQAVIANAMHNPVCFAFFELLAGADHSDPGAGLSHYRQLRSYTSDAAPEEESDDQPLVIEWAPFSVWPGVSEAQLLAEADRLQASFLGQQRGFIKRELLKGRDRQWLDLVYWASMGDAEQAASHVLETSVCQTFFGLMEGIDEANSAESVAYFARVKTYR